MNEMLLVIRVHANEMPCTALVNSGCSQTIVSAGLCHIWKKKSIKVTTISSEMCKCHGIETVKIHTDTGNFAEVNTLVVHERPYDFDLLLGYDAIKTLGGILITQRGMVKFCEEAPVCSTQDWPTWLWRWVQPASESVDCLMEMVEKQGTSQAPKQHYWIPCA